MLYASFNRTIIELKLDWFDPETFIYFNTFNRTIIELKQYKNTVHALAELTFNRTIIELKRLSGARVNVRQPLLIGLS